MLGGGLEILLQLLLGLSLLLVLGLPIGAALLRWSLPDSTRLELWLLSPGVGLIGISILGGTSLLLLSGFTVMGMLLLILPFWIHSMRCLLKGEGAQNDIADDAGIRMLRFAVFLVVVLSLLPLWLFNVPNGVDWIGFSSMVELLTTKGTMEVDSPDTISWSYPPAFLTTAAFLQVGLGLVASDAVHLLGRITLAFLFLGLGGICVRNNCQWQVLVASALGFGLFVKAHDSGYPTILSLIAVILSVHLMMNGTDSPKRRAALLIILISSAMIHPIAPVLISCLLIAGAITSDLMEKQHLLHLGFIAIGVIVSSLLFSDYLDGIPLQSEYGWQGGIPLLLFNGPILIVAGIWCIWRFNEQEDVRLMASWLLIIWCLTFIHLLSGMVLLASLSLLTKVIYSLGVYGFHIPLAILTGILMKKAEDDLRIPQQIPQVAIALAMLMLLVGQASLITLADHDETRIPTLHGNSIFEELSELPEDSIIYTEQAHWGFIVDDIEGIAYTSRPVLGLMDGESEVHDAATNAIRSDDGITLRGLGITHAISSPLSLLGATLTESRWWEPVIRDSGFILWSLNQNPATGIEGLAISPAKEDCIDDCQWRDDPWKEHRWWGHENLSEGRAFLTGGVIEWTVDLPSSMIGNDVEVILHHSAPDGLEVSLSSVNRTVSNYTNGHGTLVLEVESAPTGLEVSIEVYGGGKIWLNPHGLTGRSGHFIDTSGVWLNWVELRVKA